MKQNRLLIHTCCAPCLVGIYENIQNNLNEFGLNSMEQVNILWYNINIHPKVEYLKRKSTLKQYLKTVKKKGIFIDEYGIGEFIKVAKNLQDYGYRIRCEYCYKKRLEALYTYAKENGYTQVTTTLLISPYQNHDLIVNICKELENKYNIKFIYKDFRTLFREGQKRAKELGLYRQKYCGCIFSKKEGAKANEKKRIKK